MELIVPANTDENPNVKTVASKKYQSLLADLNVHPCIQEVTYTTIDVGSLSHYPLSTQALCKACSSLTRS